MAIAIGTAMTAMAVGGMALNLGTSIFSFFKGRSAKKKLESQIAAASAQQKQEIARMMQGFQGQNMGAVNGMNSSYMQPMGIGQQYGPAPQGYYPQMMG